MPGAGWAFTRTPASDTSRPSQPTNSRPQPAARRASWASFHSRNARLAHSAASAEAAFPPTASAASVHTGSPTVDRADGTHHHRPPRSSNSTLVCRSAASSPPGGGGGGADSAFGDPNSLVGMLMAYAVQLQQQQQQDQGGALGAEIRVEGIGFHPPGSERPLLEGIDMILPANRLGLVMGRSGSGKTTLLNVLAGLTEQTSGHVRVLHGRAGGWGPPAAAANGAAGNGNGNGNGLPQPAVVPGLTVEERMQQVGLVFQFPERHFLGADLMQELTFTWPRLTQYWGERQALSAKMQQVLEAVGLADIPLHVPPWALSGGQQRRLALAIQLVRQPALLLLDEPLAGLDWTARQEVVTILRKLKEQCTLLVVSHDLAEIAPLVDCAWRMRTGGTCEAVSWPPSDLAGLEQ